LTQPTRTKGRQAGDREDQPADVKPSSTPPKPPHPDDVAVKPEHPGNIPAGTPANPVEWGEPYEVPGDKDDAAEIRRRRRELASERVSPKKHSR